MAIAEASEAGSYLSGGDGLAPPSGVDRRDQVEAVGLLLGILVILLFVVVALGTTPGLT
jgi:hypothetical protein